MAKADAAGSKLAALAAIETEITQQGAPA